MSVANPPCVEFCMGSTPGGGQQFTGTFNATNLSYPIPTGYSALAF